MYTKEYALGHAPRAVARTTSGLYECPVCGANYSRSGSTWIQHTPSSILQDDYRFRLYIEERREAFGAKLANKAADSLNQASYHISNAMHGIGETIGDSICDAGRVHAQAMLMTELIRGKREEELQRRQHAHEEMLFDRHVDHERDLLAQERLLKFFELAFTSFDLETRRRMIESAFRIAEYERRISAFKQHALGTVQQEAGLLSVSQQVKALEASSRFVKDEEMTNAEIETLEQHRIFLRDKMISLKKKKVKIPWLFSLFSFGAVQSTEQEKKATQKHLTSIAKEVDRKRTELGNALRLKINMGISNLSRNQESLRANLLSEAQQRVSEFNKRLLTWRDEALNKLPEHVRPLCYQLSDLFTQG